MLDRVSRCFLNQLVRSGRLVNPEWVGALGLVNPEWVGVSESGGALRIADDCFIGAGLVEVGVEHWVVVICRELVEFLQLGGDASNPAGAFDPASERLTSIAFVVEATHDSQRCLGRVLGGEA